MAGRNRATVIIVSAVYFTACGGGSTSPTSGPGPVTTGTMAALEAAIRQAYSQVFAEQISRPALYDNFSCGGDHVTSTAYSRQSATTSRLLSLYTSRDGGTVTRSAQATVLTPAGTFQVLTVLVGYPQTLNESGVGLWQAAQGQINEDHASFARARGYGSPIVAFNNTSLLIDASQVADPRTLTGLSAALAHQGRSVTGYDFVVSVNIDPSRSEGGFATPGSMPAFIYMGNFSNWKDPLTAGDFTSIAGAVYHHEVVHHWGWPGTHDWATCGPASGFNFLVPPVLLGWEDVDGDGVPEILDTTPYGRSRP